MKHQSIRHMTEVNCRDAENKDDPACSCQVDSCLNLSFSFQTVRDIEFGSLLSHTNDLILFKVAIVVDIGVNLTLIRVHFDQFCVPWMTRRVSYLHHDCWMVVLISHVRVPSGDTLLSHFDSLLVCKPAGFIVVVPHEQEDGIDIDQLLLHVGV